jgi:hypothetical protein
MQLRSLQITIYAGALTLIACGSSNSANSDPFESATQEPNVKPDASTSSSGGSSSGGSSGASSGSSGSSGGIDTTGTNGSCKQDSDCSGQCGDSSVCCCETSSSTCYSPPSGQCGSSGDSGSAGDDSGGDDSGDNTQPI